MDAEKQILELSLSAPSEPSATWTKATQIQAAALYPTTWVVSHAAHVALREADESVTRAALAAKGRLDTPREELYYILTRRRKANPTPGMLRDMWITEQKGTRMAGVLGAQTMASDARPRALSAFPTALVPHYANAK